MSRSSHADCKRRRNEDNRAMSAAKAAAGVKYITGRIDADTVAARLAEIPADTRDLTQRMFGDPLPGRDALSRLSREKATQ